MGKISKYSNLYSKNGELLHKPGKYTIEEIEQLLDKLGQDNTETVEYKNTFSTLLSMYEKYGNPHIDDIVQKLNDYAKSKTTKKEVVEALNEVKDEQ